MAVWRRSKQKVERRRAERLKPERLLAHYWTGGFSAPYPVLEISLTGALITSAAVYYPGTVIRLAFEDAAIAADPAHAVQFASVWGKVLRNLENGFCVRFGFENRAEQMQFRRFLEQLSGRGLDDGCKN
jgi:hypothetical protein